METSEAPYKLDALENQEGAFVLSLYPLINDGHWGNVSQVGSEILEQLEKLKTPTLIVDLSPVDYMGSAQVALIVRVWKALKLKECEQRMVVQCPGAMVREVLTLSGLEKVWKIVETREAAYDALGLQMGPTTAGFPIMPVMAVVAVLGALLGAAGAMGLLNFLAGPTGAWLAIGSGLLAVVLGIVAAMSRSGTTRGLAIVVCLLGVAAGAAGGVQLQQPPQNAAQDPGDDPANVGEPDLGKPAAAPQHASEKSGAAAQTAEDVAKTPSG